MNGSKVHCPIKQSSSGFLSSIVITTESMSLIRFSSCSTHNCFLPFFIHTSLPTHSFQVPISRLPIISRFRQISESVPPPPTSRFSLPTSLVSCFSLPIPHLSFRLLFPIGTHTNNSCSPFATLTSTSPSPFCSS